MILSGKPVADSILQRISALNIQAKFAIIQVGDNAASNIYIKQKIETAKKLNFSCSHFKFDETVTFSELKAFIEELNAQKDLNGMIVQMPLPPHLTGIINCIDYRKDIDGLGMVQQGKLFLGHDDALLSCTPKGVIYLLKHYNIALSAKKVVVMGRSNLVGKPLAMLLLKEDAEVTILHSRCVDVAAVLRGADIVCAAIGVPGLIKKDWLKPDCIVIDVGISRVEGRICGDVNKEAYEKISAYSPVPGGVGLVTVACLMENVSQAYCRQNGI